MKKFIALSLAILMLAAALAGCSPKQVEEVIAGLNQTNAPTAEQDQNLPSMVAAQEFLADTDITAPVAPGNGSVMLQKTPPQEPLIGYAPPVEEPNTEEYSHLGETGFASPLQSPLSTFAADVDTASYANIRRMIRHQQRIPADAVRIEEMINAFSYHYAPPKGDAPVAIKTQVAPCPWNAKNLLLRVGLQAQDIPREESQPSNLVFLIDTSGSMDDPLKLPLVQRSFALLVEQLTEKDRVSIVTYAGSATVMLEGARGDDQARILSAISDLSAWGGTHGSEGIVTAYKLAAQYQAAGVNSRVILATDGDFNIGQTSEGQLINLIEEERKKGVFLTVMGFGYGNLKDNNMEALADHGNGNCTYIDSIHQARRALVEEMGATLYTVAKDVKLQIEFNPATVEGYRLVGYENRRLNAQDFADDTKDGGEMGAGHRVTALYEIIPAGAGVMPTANLTYQQSLASDKTDFATVHVRYKQPQGETSTEITQVVGKDALTDAMDEDFRLAAAVAAFGQMLTGSQYKGSADEKLVLSLVQPLLSSDEGGRIVEFADLVRKSTGLY